MIRFKRGDKVTIMPPYEQAMLEHQHYAVVDDEPAPGQYVVVLDATIPPNGRFGPYPTERLAPGWKDANGRWRVAP